MTFEHIKAKKKTNFSVSLTYFIITRKTKIDKSFLIADNRKRRSRRKKNRVYDQERKFNSMYAIKNERKKIIYY